MLRERWWTDESSWAALHVNRCGIGAVVHVTTEWDSDGSRLAIDGGSPVRSTPWPSWPSYSKEEVALVADVLAGGLVNYWTGTHGRQFEAEYANYLGVCGTVALMNGTVALEASLRALGIGEGDEVIVPCRTFIASASCVVAVGARPVLADVDPVTQCVTAACVAVKVSDRTRAVIAVHLAGMVCDLDPIVSLCHERGIALIEDCAQAHGARYKDRPVGSIGDVGAFSFCQDKIITTGGEGGLVATDDAALLDRIVRYKDHGKDPELVAAARMRGAGGFAYLHSSFGTNWRMTEMQAALGRHQLRRLDESVARRRYLAERLSRSIADVDGISVVPAPPWAVWAYYRLSLRIDQSRLIHGWSRDRIVSALIAENVWAGPGACPDIGHEHAFDAVPGARDARPGAESIAGESLVLQVHPALADGDIDSTAEAIARVMRHATGAADA